MYWMLLPPWMLRFTADRESERRCEEHIVAAALAAARHEGGATPNPHRVTPDRHAAAPAPAPSRYANDGRVRVPSLTAAAGLYPPDPPCWLGTAFDVRAIPVHRTVTRSGDTLGIHTRPPLMTAAGPRDLRAGPIADLEGQTAWIRPLK